MPTSSPGDACESTDRSHREINSGAFQRGKIGAANTVAGMVSGQIVTAIALILLARRCSLSDFGSFISLYVAAITVGGLIDFGSSSLWARDLARGSPNGAFWHIVIRRTIISTVPVFALTVVSIGLLRSELPVWCIVGLSLQALTFGLSNATSGAVRALDHPARAEWCVACGNLIFAAVVALSPKGELLRNAGFAASGSWFVTSALGFAILHGRFDQEARKSFQFKNPWHGSKHFGLASVAVLLGGFTLPLVGAFAGSDAAATLGAVARWSQPVTLIAASSASFIAPRFASAASDAKAAALLRQVLPLILLGIFISMAIVVAAPTLVSFLLGSNYTASVALVRLSSLAAIPVLLGQPTVTLLQARGHERSVSRALLLFSVVSLVFAVGLSAAAGPAAVPVVGLIGNSLIAAWAVKSVVTLLR